MANGNVVTITNEKKPAEGWAVFYDKVGLPILVWAPQVILIRGVADGGSLIEVHQSLSVWISAEPFSVAVALDAAHKKWLEVEER